MYFPLNSTKYSSRNLFQQTKLKTYHSIVTNWNIAQKFNSSRNSCLNLAGCQLSDKARNGNIWRNTRKSDCVTGNLNITMLFKVNPYIEFYKRLTLSGNPAVRAASRAMLLVRASWMTVPATTWPISSYGILVRSTRPKQRNYLLQVYIRKRTYLQKRHVASLQPRDPCKLLLRWRKEFGPHQSTQYLVDSMIVLWLEHSRMRHGLPKRTTKKAKRGFCVNQTSQD